MTNAATSAPASTRTIPVLLLVFALTGRAFHLPADKAGFAKPLSADAIAGAAVAMSIRVIGWNSPPVRWPETAGLSAGSRLARGRRKHRAGHVVRRTARRQHRECGDQHGGQRSNCGRPMAGFPRTHRLRLSFAGTSAICGSHATHMLSPAPRPATHFALPGTSRQIDWRRTTLAVLVDLRTPGRSWWRGRSVPVPGRGRCCLDLRSQRPEGRIPRPAPRPPSEPTASPCCSPSRSFIAPFVSLPLVRGVKVSPPQMLSPSHAGEGGPPPPS
jgi:hypothetical protein